MGNINEDIKFVHSLYSVANETTTKKIDFLFFIIVLIVISLIIWANIAQVDELTTGQGKVIPSSKIQKVQYYDGGIISDILVSEGDIIHKDQDLMLIDTTRFKATLEETKESLLSLRVEKNRYEKELLLNYHRTSLPSLHFNKDLNQKAKQYIALQKNIFKNNFYERQNSIEVILLQQDQKIQELLEIQAKVKQLTGSLKLVTQNYQMIAKMVKSGSKSKLDLINIKKEVHTISGDLKIAKLSIPRSQLAIKEFEKLLDEKIQSIKVKTSLALQEIANEMTKLEARLISDADKLDKTVIKSPIDGIIKSINVSTIGSVVQSGVDLIEIIPNSGNLLIEAKIDPKDIAFINPSLKAIVKLTSYDFSIYGGLDATIIKISADSIIDENSRDDKPYYRIVVKANHNFLEYNEEKLPIIPGMIASVDIVTGKKTIMDFILKPILKVKQGALHER